MDLHDKKISPVLKLPDLYKFVNENQTLMTESLKEAVAIPSASQDEKNFPDVIKMLKLCQSKMEELGATTELLTSLNSRTKGGVAYPPVLFANLFVDEELKTICVYGHVDTLSRSIEKASGTDNFDLSIKDGRIHGCGVSRSKGPFFCWLNALKVYVATKTPIPVNVKFVVEGAAELHSPTLNDLVQRKKDFFRDVDYICLTVDKKINEEPCLRYGYRGVCHFSLDISCGAKEIDSGTYGGAFNQPLIDAAVAVSSLMDKYDKLSLPNLTRDVASLSLVEKEAIDAVQLNVEDVKQKIGVKRLRHKEISSRIVAHKTRLPSFSIHGFETNSGSDAENKAAVPSRTVAKFSIRLVPDQTVRDTRIHVENYLRKAWSQCKSSNDFQINMDLGIEPWKEDPKSPHFKAAANAIKSVYGKEPLYVCDGCSLPAVSILKSISPQSNSLVLPLSDSDDRNEKDESMSIENYLNGVKVVMAYMCYVHEI